MPENETTDEERTDDEDVPADDESSEAAESSDDVEVSDDGEEVETTAPGEWERKPSDEEDLRHDDGSEPLAEPSDEDDDDLAEKEAGEVKASGDDDDEEDEDFDRPDPPDEAGLEDTGDSLEQHGEPLLQGSEIKTPVGGLPTRSLLAMLVFVVIFCAAFFGLWAALGNIGILLGIIVGVGLGLGAMKLMADRAA